MEEEEQPLGLERGMERYTWKGRNPRIKGRVRKGFLMKSKGSW